MKATVARASARRWGTAGAALLVFLSPPGREVAVEVELLFDTFGLNRHAIVIVDRAFGQQAVV
jgi:hypothetical protein